MTNQVSSGLSAMLGAGLLVGLAPAASVAGWWLLAGLVLAGLLAVACGLSKSELSISDSSVPVPSPLMLLGGLGRVAAAAAVVLAFGRYVLPDNPLPAAVGLLAAAVALTASGWRPSRTLLRLAAGLVLAVLAVFVAACLAIAPAGSAVPPPRGAPGTDDLAGVPAATVLMFFCFLGFQRVSSRGRRVLTIAVALVVNLAVAGTALYQLGGPRLALSAAPLRDALAAADASGLSGLLAVGATVATLSVLLGLLDDLRAGTRPVLVPVAGVGAAAGAVLLTVPVAIAVAAGLLLVRHGLAAVLTWRGARGSVPPR